MNPQYQHDCSSCIFLGPYEAGGRNYDLWVCPGGPDLIARFSSEGPDYGSMPADMLAQFKRSRSPNAAIYVEIGKRAKARGIIP